MRVLISALALVLAAACGPVQSATVIWQADAELAGARAADGQKNAPYEMTAAEIYLEKAREEESYADFDPAIQYGTKARDMARSAKNKAAAARNRGAPPSEPPPMIDEPSAGTTPVHIVPVPPSDGAGSGPVVVPVPE